MNWMQKLLVRVTPTISGETAEQESRRWMVRCPHCGAEQSIWDMGGVRYKATGSSWTLRKCRLKCGKIGWHKVYKRKA